MDHPPKRKRSLLWLLPGGRPPQVQGARVTVADGFFPRRLTVDSVQRQGDLDELFSISNHRWVIFHRLFH